MSRRVPRGHGSWGNTQWTLNARSCPYIEKSTVEAHVVRGEQVHHTEHIWYKIPTRYALTNIHGVVEEVLERSEVVDGFAFVSAMHITSGIYVNDAEGGLLKDISEFLDDLAPYNVEKYEHHRGGEDNADAHLKSFLTNHFLTAPITNGQLDLGTWQQIFLMEGDGMRSKRLLIKVTGLKK